MESGEWSRDSGSIIGLFVGGRDRSSVRSSGCRIDHRSVRSVRAEARAETGESELAWGREMAERRFRDRSVVPRVRDWHGDKGPAARPSRDTARRLEKRKDPRARCRRRGALVRARVEGRNARTRPSRRRPRHARRRRAPRRRALRCGAAASRRPSTARRARPRPRARTAAPASSCRSPCRPRRRRPGGAPRSRGGGGGRGGVSLPRL